jgi:hypothetical protein
MSQPANKDRSVYFLIYLVAGMSMGGFLDVVAFDQPTPFYGMILGAVIAICYQAAIWIAHRRRS